METKDIISIEHQFQAKHKDILVNEMENFKFADEKIMVKPILQNKASSVVVCNLKSISLAYQELVNTYGDLLSYSYFVEEFSDATFLEFLKDLGFTFQCWTKGQINACKSAGITDDNIIYNHFSTEQTILRNIKETGIKNSFIDEVDDIEKFKTIWPDAHLSIQMTFTEDNKFGMKCLNFEYAKNLATKCKEAGLTVNGLILPNNLFNKSDEIRKCYFNEAAEFIKWAHTNGIQITKCSIGADNEIDDDNFCIVQKGAEISAELKSSFGGINGLKLTFDATITVTEEAFNLYVQVIGVKKLRDETEVDPKKVATTAYYLTEGIYGCLTYFFETELDDIDYEAYKEDTEDASTHIKTVLWGPTCDSLDVCKAIVDLPKLDIGDWIIFPSIGGQAISLRSDFNWVDKYTMVYYFAAMEEEEEEPKK